MQLGPAMGFSSVPLIPIYVFRITSRQIYPLCAYPTSFRATAFQRQSPYYMVIYGWMTSFHGIPPRYMRPIRSRECNNMGALAAFGKAFRFEGIATIDEPVEQDHGQANRSVIMLRMFHPLSPWAEHTVHSTLFKPKVVQYIQYFEL